jgi:hypothetical protein
MLPSLFDRPGWRDEVGPLWFLRPRWSAGPAWRRTWVRFFASDVGITCQAHSKRGSYAVAGMFIPRGLWVDLGYAQKEDIVMGWVSKQRRPADGASAPAVSSDPEWVLQLPALHEFCTLERHDDGTARRVSTVTIFADGGSWKVFCNERDLGCSLCASGPTIAEALGALEVMLESENPPWRLSGATNGSPRKKPK